MIHGHFFWSEHFFFFFICFSSVKSHSCVWLFVTPWPTACQASLSITNSQSLLKLMSIELVMPSNHFILCHPLLLLPSIFPSIRVFSKESFLCIRWPKYWHFSFIYLFITKELSCSFHYWSLQIGTYPLTFNSYDKIPHNVIMELYINPMLQWNTES